MWLKMYADLKMLTKRLLNETQKWKTVRTRIYKIAVKNEIDQSVKRYR
jgi:hypothetical protein